MSGWSETISTVVKSIRDIVRWRRIKRVKKYENDKDVIRELNRRADIRRMQKSDSE